MSNVMGVEDSQPARGPCARGRLADGVRPARPKRGSKLNLRKEGEKSSSLGQCQGTVRFRVEQRGGVLGAGSWIIATTQLRLSVSPHLGKSTTNTCCACPCAGGPGCGWLQLHARGRPLSSCSCLPGAAEAASEHHSGSFQAGGLCQRSKT